MPTTAHRHQGSDWTRVALFVAVCLLLAACAPAVVQVPASSLVPHDGKHLRLSETVEIGLSTGYTSVLRARTTWQLIGRIEQGEVYKPRNQVLTVEGAHIHEAYLVVKDGNLVGFFLPVEKTFSPISEKLFLPVER